MGCLKVKNLFSARSTGCYIKWKEHRSMRDREKTKIRKNVPHGGRAFQRIQQDRTARGLGKLPLPGTSGPVPNKRAPNERMGKTRKKN